MPEAANEVLVPPDAGETIRDDDRLQSALIASREQITITRYRMADGQRGPDPHVHHEHTDAFYVLEGELSFLLGPDRERVSVGAGGLVAAPPNVVHTFNNDTGAEARFLNFHTPDGGFGQFMRDIRDGDNGRLVRHVRPARRRRAAAERGGDLTARARASAWSRETGSRC